MFYRRGRGVGNVFGMHSACFQNVLFDTHSNCFRIVFECFLECWVNAEDVDEFFHRSASVKYSPLSAYIVSRCRQLNKLFHMLSKLKLRNVANLWFFQKCETKMEEDVSNLIIYFQCAELAKHKTWTQTRILCSKERNRNEVTELMEFSKLT